MDTHTGLHENISALLDGELAASELELAFAALDTDSGRQAWDLYHRIGDALRSGQCGHELGPHFEARLASRLEVEAQHVPALLPTPGAAPLVQPGAAEPLDAVPVAQQR